MPGFSLLCKNLDGILPKYGNQLGALGQGRARAAMARALNYGGRQVHVAVKRELVKQTSIPRAVVQGAVKAHPAAHRGAGGLVFEIYASGSELPLSQFSPRQFTFGVRAKVWGRLQRFPGMFGAPGDDPATIGALGGAIFHRTSAPRLPIEKSYGPSIPKEMVKDATADVFMSTGAQAVDRRLRHELGRMIMGLS